jgi:tRNA-splicing ligase RtcB
MMDVGKGAMKTRVVSTGEATGILPSGDDRVSPVTVIGTRKIRDAFDSGCLQQAVNARLGPGVTDVVLNPDAHIGYGAPIGCVLASPSHIYPGPVGVDIKCSMSLLQLDLPAAEIADRRIRRDLIRAITDRTPTGAGRGQRSVPKARHVDPAFGRVVVAEGASPRVCEALGVPPEWAARCEDAWHVGHDGSRDALAERIDRILDRGSFPKYQDKISQLGSYGSGNHFGECEVVEVTKDPAAQVTAEAFGLQDGHVAFLSHCGSRGFGFHLATGQFKKLEAHFKKRGLPFPGGDRQLVYAELGSPQANAYLDDMALGGNFATVNHLLINALVLEAFQELIPGVNGRLVYLISHNIARLEELRGRPTWVHRKGATRAFPANHSGLAGTPFQRTGHPILLPGDPRSGSAVMVAEAGAEMSCFSINHGAGRTMGRKAAFRNLDQRAIDRELEAEDILTNCRFYPRDEAPAAYKDFEEVLRSVELAGLATEVARLRARFVIKDADKSTRGAA